MFLGWAGEGAWARRQRLDGGGTGEAAWEALLSRGVPKALQARRCQHLIHQYWNRVEGGALTKRDGTSSP
jgi:hypothetical protein